MSISILMLDKLYNDANFKDTKVDLYFHSSFNCRDKVDDNKEYSRGNSKPCCESQIMTL